MVPVLMWIIIGIIVALLLISGIVLGIIFLVRSKSNKRPANDSSYCANCGKPLQQYSKYCTGCGHGL